VAETCYLPVETVEEWVGALAGPMRQAFFYGPPGTGKTFIAIQLAHHLASSPEHVELVQFHASYSYESRGAPGMWQGMRRLRRPPHQRDTKVTVTG
jgi:predicted ATPase with chaperone activity